VERRAVSITANLARGREVAYALGQASAGIQAEHYYEERGCAVEFDDEGCVIEDVDCPEQIEK
jgi:hypothetical protein